VVYFDRDCTLCRELAQLMARRAGDGLAFKAWQDERPGEPAAVLRVKAATGMLEGDEAWAFVVERHPDLAGLTWMARKLGLAAPERAVGKAVGVGLGLLRKLCWRC